MQFVSFICERKDPLTGAAVLLPGATLSVFLAGTSTLASLFNISGASIGNPVTADTNATASFAAPDGEYDIQFVSADLSYTSPKLLKTQIADVLNLTTAGVVVATRTALASVSSPTSGMSRYLAEAGREGWFVFSTANLSAQVSADTAQGIYVAPSGATSGASGAWVRKFVGPASVKWFGTVGDGTTDDSNAFVVAIATLKSVALSGFGYGNLGGPKLYVPSGAYNINTTTLDLTHGIIIEGESTGYVGSSTSVLKWAAGITGIRFEAANTSGTTTVASRGYSSYPIIRCLTLYGTYSGTESEAHGIDMRQNGAVEDVGIFNFAGDGIHMVATAGSGGGTEGNDNGWFLKRVCIQGCRNGVKIDGADTNAGMAMALNLINNRRWGIWDSSFLGNTHIGHQTAGNGAVAGTHPPSWVSQGGNRYVVKAGQETGASTNAPSGTTADNTWWYYYSAGAPDSTINCPAWLSGTTYRSGGCYLTDDVGDAGNVFDGCYIEGSQPFAQFVAPTLVQGGSMVPNVKGVPCLVADSSNIKSTNGLAAVGNLTILGNINSLGPQSGAAADATFTLYNTSTSSFLQAISATNGTIGSLNFLFGTGIRYNINNGGWSHHFQINGTNTVAITATGAGYETGVGGAVTQVTGKSTAVTLNKVCGQVTLNNAALAAGANVTFTVNDSNIASTDTIILNLQSGNATDGTYDYRIGAIGAGTFKITLENRSGASLSEALVFNYTIIKGANS